MPSVTTAFSHRRVQRDDGRRLVVEGVVQQHLQLVDEPNDELVVIVQELDVHIAVFSQLVLVGHLMRHKL